MNWRHFIPTKDDLLMCVGILCGAACAAVLLITIHEVVVQKLPERSVRSEIEELKVRVAILEELWRMDQENKENE